MKIENQVCALYQAQRLKELGVPQVGGHYYYTGDTARNIDLLLPLSPTMTHDNMCFVAYNAAELGEMLPSEVNVCREPGITMRVWHAASDDYQVAFPGYTEAQAKADMLIWLLEKGHYTVAEIEADNADL